MHYGIGWGERQRVYYNVILLEKLCKKVLYSIMAKIIFQSKVIPLFLPKCSKFHYSEMYTQKQPPRQFSKISVLFFQEQPFYNFPEGSICSSNRHEFSRRVHLFVEQTWIFQEGLYVLRTDMNFPGGLIEKTRFFKEVLSVHRTDTNFPRNPYLILEHIRIFQEPLFSHRTDTHFPGSPI